MGLTKKSSAIFLLRSIQRLNSAWGGEFLKPSAGFANAGSPRSCLARAQLDENFQQRGKATSEMVAANGQGDPAPRVLQALT